MFGETKYYYFENSILESAWRLMWGIEGRPPPLKTRRGVPSWKKYFFLSHHKWPEFEIIQNPGEWGLNIFGARRAPLPENPLSPEIFISSHWFYLNGGTIDLLCIILLIRTVVAWDFLYNKKKILRPLHDCLETA